MSASLQENPGLCWKCQAILNSECPEGLEIRKDGYRRVLYTNHPLHATALNGCNLCLHLLYSFNSLDRATLQQWTKAKEKGNWPADIKFELHIFCCGQLRLHNKIFLKVYPENNRTDQNGDRGDALWSFLILLPEIDMLPFANHGEIHGSTNSGPSRAIVTSWLDQCVKTHETCNPLANEGATRPTRIIDCSSGNPRLLLVRDDTPPFLYATMSHCWGTHMPLRLLSSNIDDMQVSIPVARLSQSFKDAIQVLQWLGLDYIWIDSLCIVQDSPADWQKESVTMADVYSNSHCNIAATHAADGTHGCFIERDARLVKPLKVGVNWIQTPAVYYVSQWDYWEKQVMDTPLNARAWVCQERYLAPRTLSFGGRQLYWECQCCSASETFPLGLPPGVKRMVKSLEPSKAGPAIRQRMPKPYSPELDAFALWDEIVHQFSKGQLTFPEDKLVAVSGLASRMHKHTRSDYLAGLWRKHLPHQLLWEVDDGERHAVYTAPSWSWASMSGRIRSDGYSDDDKTVLEIQEAKIQLVNEASPFGKAKSGHIRAKGYLASAGFHFGRWDSSLSAFILHINDDIIGDAVFDEDHMNKEITHRALHYLPIRYNPTPEVEGIDRGIEGLICEAASPDPATEFKRIGMFYTYAGTSNYELFQAACRQHSTGSQEYVTAEGCSREWGPQLEFTLV